MISKIKAFIRRYKLLVYLPIFGLTISNYMLRQDIVMLNRDVTYLQKTNEQLLSDMVLYNRSYEEFPLEIWQKVKRGMDFISQYFNPAYERRFFIPLGYNRYEKMGETDFENFDHKTALIYYNRDLQIALDGGSRIFTETYLDSAYNRKELQVLKWRVIERQDTLIYGMVLPKKN